MSATDLLEFRLHQAKDLAAYAAGTEGAGLEDRKAALVELKDYCDLLLDELDEEAAGEKR